MYSLGVRTVRGRPVATSERRGAEVAAAAGDGERRAAGCDERGRWWAGWTGGRKAPRRSASLQRRRAPWCSDWRRRRRSGIGAAQSGQAIGGSVQRLVFLGETEAG